MKRAPVFTPVVYEYLKRFQEDPSSRVFAPLAEAYRKAGLLKDAVAIAREGLRVHPHFVGGRVALARALFDLKEYDEVIKELRELIVDVPDNLVAQRLFAESCLMRGQLEEALSSYKMILYFVPSDQETAQIVQELEASGYRLGQTVLKKENEPESGFQVQALAQVVKNDPVQASAEQKRRKSSAIEGVEKLTRFLQKVERYRARLTGEGRFG